MACGVPHEQADAASGKSGRAAARTERVGAGDTLIINAGATLTVENPTAETAVTWVTTSLGLEAELADGTRIVPPWAN